MARRLILGTLAICLGLTAAQDCSALLGSTGRKRFILDSIANTFNSFNKLPKQIVEILPGHPEVNSHCRFDLTSLSDSQTQTLKTLYNEGYSLCVGCSQVNSDHGRCHSIEVCRKGTSCIQGYNENRTPTYYWHGCCNDSDPKCRSSCIQGYNEIRTPTYYWHGCCVDSDPNCRSGVFNVDIPYYKDNTYPIPYRKTVCKGPVCNENGYTSQKNDLINKLVGTTAAPVVTTQAPPQTTTAPIPVGPINGGFTQWSTWGACDKSCDIGVRIRTRACTNPVPANGGADCTGVTKETELCNVNPCS